MKDRGGKMSSVWRCPKCKQWKVELLAEACHALIEFDKGIDENNPLPK